MRITHVLIAHGGEIFRAGFRAMLSGDPTLRFLEATTGEAAVRLAPRSEVMLLDERIPGMSALEVVRQIAQKSPTTRVIVVLENRNEAYVLSAIQAGAMGVIVDSIGAEELRHFVLAVARGEPAADPTLIQTKNASVLLALSDRERRILTLIAGGLTNPQIAEKLGAANVSVIRNQVSGLLKKLGRRHRADLAIFAVQHPPLRPVSPDSAT